MRRKRLIIGLFTAALVAAAVPVASAATNDGRTPNPKGCKYVRYYAPVNTEVKWWQSGGWVKMKLKEPSLLRVNPRERNWEAQYGWTVGDAYFKQGNHWRNIGALQMRTTEIRTSYNCW